MIIRDFVDSGLLLGAMILCGLLLFGTMPIVGAAYYRACRQAEIYNTQNGTQWTCGDFFWAGDQINRGVYTLNQGRKK